MLWCAETQMSSCGADRNVLKKSCVTTGDQYCSKLVIQTHANLYIFMVKDVHILWKWIICSSYPDKRPTRSIYSHLKKECQFVWENYVRVCGCVLWWKVPIWASLWINWIASLNVEKKQTKLAVPSADEDTSQIHPEKVPLTLFAHQW